MLNNVFLCSICAVVFTGTAYPPLVELVFGAKLSVGPPYFDLTVLPLCMPLFAAMPVGSVLPWKHADLWPALQRLWWAAKLAAAVGVIRLFGLGHGLAALAFAGAAWLIVGSAAQVLGRSRLFRLPIAQGSRVQGPPSQYGDRRWRMPGWASQWRGSPACRWRRAISRLSGQVTPICRI